MAELHYFERRNTMHETSIFDINCMLSYSCSLKRKGKCTYIAPQAATAAAEALYVRQSGRAAYRL